MKATLYFEISCSEGTITLAADTSLDFVPPDGMPIDVGDKDFSVTSTYYSIPHATLTVLLDGYRFETKDAVVREAEIWTNEDDGEGTLYWRIHDTHME